MNARHDEAPITPPNVLLWSGLFAYSAASVFAMVGAWDIAAFLVAMGVLLHGARFGVRRR